MHRSILVISLVMLTVACVPNTGGFSGTTPRATNTEQPTTVLPTATALPPSPTATLPPTTAPTPTLTPTLTITPAPTPVVLSGAGDIAVCGLQGSALTAKLLAKLPGTIFTAGDNSNESGEMYQYQQCFGPTWGQFLDRIRPAPGNHDYLAKGASNYYQYFGLSAGEPGLGYYSYDLGSWHIISLNSNCSQVACGPNSAQMEWLRADLAAHPSRCSLAYWHHPRFSSGLSGSFGLKGFWDVLYEYGVDIVINGNDHDYERFAPQDPNGVADPEHGIREFVVGTGGAGQRVMLDPQPNSEVRHTGTFGVLSLTLNDTSYDWQFLPIEGESFTDSGMGICSN